MILAASLTWPPEPFIWRTLLELARSGFSLQVGVYLPRKQKIVSNELRIFRLSSWEISLAGRFLNFLWLLIKAIFYPLSLLRLLARLKSEARPNALQCRDQIRLLYQTLPFVGLKRPDILYFPWVPSATIQEVLSQFFNCPNIVSCRGAQINVEPHLPDRSGIRENLKAVFEKADLIHCVSEAIKNEAINYGLDAEKTRVIYPAVDPDFFCPSNSKPSNDSFRVATTGSLIWKKGYEYALLAIRRLIDRGAHAHFDIIGDGPERQRVLYTIQELELQDHVKIHGHLLPEEVRNILQQSDVFLLASLSEGISNAALEAMACGLPVVTTDCGGMREAVTDGIEGFVVPVRDPEIMALKLYQLAQDPSLRLKMAAAARQRILKDFSLNGQIQRFVECFQELQKN